VKPRLPSIGAAAVSLKCNAIGFLGVSSKSLVVEETFGEPSLLRGVPQGNGAYQGSAQQEVPISGSVEHQFRTSFVGDEAFGEPTLLGARGSGLAALVGGTTFAEPDKGTTRTRAIGHCSTSPSVRS
jgi:hypothetical protein